MIFLKGYRKLDPFPFQIAIMKINIDTVEPIFSDNCCYNDRFTNPRFFLYLSHTIYFYNNEYKKSLSAVITTTLSESLGIRQKEMRLDCMRKRSQTCASQPPPHKHSLAVADTFFGLASPISITQGVWSSEL